ERNSSYEEITDRAAKEGDTANIDYSGSVDGVKFEGGTSAGYDLVLGSHSFIPGFEEGVVGMTVGEEKDIEVTFPEEYHAKDLAGKKAVFAVKVNALKLKVLPELTDDLVKDGSEYQTVQELEEGIKANLKSSKERQAKMEDENKIIEKITEATEVEVPEILIEKQIDNMVQDMEYRMMYQGLKLDDYLKYAGTTREELRKNYRAGAERQVKSQLVVDAIIDKEGFKATQEEIDAKLTETAEKSGKTLEDFKKTVSEYQLEYVEREIIIEKLFDFLRTNNEIA
ncbi:MAG: trigger factor, partial [Clostridia bacterium]|nr:trigger factor [Clostridia bacterium]